MEATTAELLQAKFSEVLMKNESLHVAREATGIADRALTQAQAESDGAHVAEDTAHRELDETIDALKAALDAIR